jgi:2-hydroxychromene-2-carboxylate isomerase
MPAPIEFYFDFSSPYGYIGSARIDSIAAKFGRETIWRPILLGVVFRVTGAQPLPSLPLKGDYAKRDMSRFARLWDVPFRVPTHFPVATQAPARAFYWLTDRDPSLAKRLAHALYHAYFAEDRDISSPETTADVANSIGLDRNSALAALADPGVKERLRQENDAAIARGVFGSPFVIVDGEPFWGADRLDHVERWLATGGW